MRIVVRQVDVSPVEARMPTAKAAALGITAMTALGDATHHVPMSMRTRGTNLRSSGRAYPTVAGNACVEWGGDGKTARYAGPQHAGRAGRLVFRNYTTPGTGSHWFDAAADSRREAWLRCFAQEYARRVHG